jgi:DNA mismatch endonuclease (patch repair protein)
MDTVSRAVRSRMMSRIKGKDTAPELVVRRALHAAGLRFRLHVTGLPGAPDIVLPRHRTVVLVHGCFWHRHPGCANARLPGTNRLFWRRKLTANVRRDAKVMRELHALGWRVMVVWECETIRAGRMRRLAGRIRGRQGDVA